MRISDWSSDVCSSDLVDRPVGDHPTQNEVKAGGIYGVEGRTTDPDVTRGRERSAGLQYAARQFEAAGDIAKRSVGRDVERAGIDKRPTGIAICASQRQRATTGLGQAACARDHAR